MDKKLIDWLRKYYSVPETVSDDDVIKDLGDSFGAAFFRLDEAMAEFKSAVYDTLPKWSKW